MGLGDIKYKMTRLTNTIANSAEAKVETLTWGYTRKCASKLPDNAIVLDKLLAREKLRNRYGGGCICDELLLEERVSVINSGVPPTIIEDINNKGYIKWLYAHPDCVVKTHYQKWCEQFVCDLSVVMAVQAKEECDLSLLTFISADDACNLGLDAIKVALDRVCQLDVGTTITQHGCELGAQVFLAKNYCNISSEIKIESVDCKLGAEATISENKCDITQDFRVDKSTCKLAHSVFISEHGCNLDFKRFIRATKGLNNCF